MIFSKINKTKKKSFENDVIKNDEFFESIDK